MQWKRIFSTRSLASAYSLRCYDLAVSLSIVRVAAIIFDLDGVLANSISVVEEAWAIWCAENGLDFDTVMRVVHGRRKPEIVAIVAPNLDPREAIEPLTALEAERIEAVRKIPGATQLVANLPPGRWAIATSGERAGALARLRQVGITPPAVLISAENVSLGKPNPEVYLKAAKGIGIDPEKCLVFEDAPAGVAAAQAAGMAAIAVLTTYPSEDFPPDVTRIADFTQVSVSVEDVELVVALF
jgi:mannitol-1-/sugar-/sorbitol-6-phosphatase